MTSGHSIAIEPFHYESASEHVTEPPRIVALMARLGQAGGALTLVLPEVEGRYEAPLLAVDAEGLTLRIGRLRPADGNPHLRAQGVVNVYGELSGVGFHFRTSLDDGGVDDDGFRLCFPVRIDVLQRREFLRLAVDDRRGVPARMEIMQDAQAGPTFVQGVLADISLGGLSLYLPLSVELREGDVIDDCSVALPGGENLMCTLRVRHVRHNDLQGRTEVGTSFIDLGARQERIVHRYVTALERQVAWGGGLVWQPGAA